MMRLEWSLVIRKKHFAFGNGISKVNMIAHNKIEDNELRRLIRFGKVVFAGNVKLKIYGRLKCYAGKRMKRKNRIFFSTEDEALQAGYRPCGNCMQDKFHQWKQTP